MNPVTVNSSPADILDAFKASGYWAQLNGTQQQEAEKDPIAWLRGHPYLYVWKDFEGYFKAA
jgi:hypothetical protein